MRLALPLVSFMLLSIGWTRGASAEVVAQAPDIRPFESAHFDMVGTIKYDGITIDVLGDGELVPPDRETAAFKFGPVTAEVVIVGDEAFSRTRFDTKWSRNTVPVVVSVGPFSASELTALERDVRRVGTETVAGALTDHYAGNIDFEAILGPLLPLVDDEIARRALESLSGSLDVWVGDRDRMVRQERIVFAVMIPAFGPGDEPTPAIVDLTLVYSKLNQPITIQKPKRDDTPPLRVPKPDIQQITGAVGAPAGPRTAPPPRAPVQLPSR